MYSQILGCQPSKLKSAAPNAFYINKLITSKLSFYEKAILLAKEEDREISSDIFRDNVSLTLVEALDLEIQKLYKSKKFATSSQYDIIRNQVAAYKNIAIDKVDIDWVDGFADHLKFENAGIPLIKRFQELNQRLGKNYTL